MLQDKSQIDFARLGKLAPTASIECLLKSSDVVHGQVVLVDPALNLLVLRHGGCEAEKIRIINAAYVQEVKVLGTPDSQQPPSTNVGASQATPEMTKETSTPAQSSRQRGSTGRHVGDMKLPPKGG